LKKESSVLEITYIFLIIGAIICAIQSIHAVRLLAAALWLAAVSVLTSVMLYLMNAPEVAVIELSVGAGLVTVLFVFTIVIPGDVTHDPPSIVPKPFAWMLFGIIFLLLAWLAWPSGNSSPTLAEPPFAEMMWEERMLDMWVQIGIIFAGVLGLLGMLAEGSVPLRKKRRLQPQEVNIS
jgi:uncharacterized MnhB-related membrane protein